MDFIGGERLGPYRLVERLGVGGMGEVYLAIDERLDRCVALKRIRTAGDASPERRERFRREARLAARLNHPSIVQIYDVLAEGEDEILVLEYVEGTTLRRMVEQAPLPPGLHNEPEPLSLAVPGVPEEFAGLVHRLLAKEPHLRPRSAAEVAVALSSWAEDVNAHPEA